MTPNTRIFISDVHIGVPGQKNWFKNQHVQPLVKFLEWVSERPEVVKDLVLLGDFFETWMAPVDETPASVQEILDLPVTPPERRLPCSVAAARRLTPPMPLAPTTH